ncbi:MAG: hypothetical protein AAF682_27455 [Planctomycetota bacterium]
MPRTSPGAPALSLAPLATLALAAPPAAGQATTPVSLPGAHDVSGASDPSISGDGRYVAYAAVDSAVHTCIDILLYDFQDGSLTNVTYCDPFAGDVSSSDPVLSGDGSTLVHTQGQLFLRPLPLSVLTISEVVSVSTGGEHADAICLDVALSRDGTQVAFHTTATNLTSPPPLFSNYYNLYVRNRASGQTVLVSETFGGAPAAAHCFKASLSADGRYVAFESAAEDLLPPGEDTNLRTDVFVRDRDPDGNGVFDEGNATTTRVSLTSAGDQADGHSQTPSISADGRFVAFASGAVNLSPTSPAAAVYEVFVHDRDPDGNGDFTDEPGTTEVVSLTSAGEVPLGYHRDPKISDDGRYVLFWSASPFVPNAAGIQVYVHDRETSWTHLVTSDAHGEPGDGPFTQARRDLALSGDATRAVFATDAANLAPGDANGLEDVYAKDLCPSAGVDQGFALAGYQGETPYLWACGELSSGSNGLLRLRDARPGSQAFLAYGFQPSPTPLFGGTVITLQFAAVVPFPIGPEGWTELPLPGGGGPLQLYAQCAVLEPDAFQGVALSNALEVQLLP